MNKREVSFYQGYDGKVWSADVIVEMQSSSRDYHIMGRPGLVEVNRISFEGTSEIDLDRQITRGLWSILHLLSDQDFYLPDPNMVLQGTPYFHASSLMGWILRRKLDGSTETQTELTSYALWEIYGDSAVCNLWTLIQGAKHYGREVKVLSGETK